jgi:hypothetical protein
MLVESKVSAAMLKLSTRQKREVYSISSLLLHLLLFIALLVTLNSCSLLHPEAEPVPETCPAETCTTLATVKDMRGLDGCGFILVLDSGEKLQPVADFDFTGLCLWTGALQQQPNANEPALTDGLRVRIGYKEVSRLNACMLGKTVQLTCLSVVPVSPPPAS